MNTRDFDIQVPREMVAQVPVEPRDQSKLLVYDRQMDSITHARFCDLPSFLEEGDCLVFNDTRVIPARLRGNLHGSPMEEIVIVLLVTLGSGGWEALVEVGEVKINDIIDFTGLYGQVLYVGQKVGKRKERIIHLWLSDEERLELAGEPPIPPYIHGYKGDPEKYQTVYSRIRGSAAAPTAGLHFTVELLNRLRHNGIKLVFVTLHVGLDTFMPVLEEHPEEHKMYSELCEVPFEAARVINDTKREGHRVIGVGTTSVRTMESAHDGNKLLPYKDWTSLYVLPGYKFKSIDGMITNFHYPKSTNLIMVCALIGLEKVKEIYKEAVKEGYRFYSFGDAMLIL
jgi:S-adenosylmethionine:tRNA ribosyltransferase-isomerase